MPDFPHRVAILGGNRVPFVRSNTACTVVSNQDMLSATLEKLAAVPAILEGPG